MGLMIRQLLARLDDVRTTAELLKHLLASTF